MKKLSLLALAVLFAAPAAFAETKTVLAANTINIASGDTNFVELKDDGAFYRSVNGGRALHVGNLLPGSMALVLRNIGRIAPQAEVVAGPRDESCEFEFTVTSYTAYSDRFPGGSKVIKNDEGCQVYEFTNRNMRLNANNLIGLFDQVRR